jgi:hypothetical protein
MSWQGISEEKLLARQMREWYHSRPGAQKEIAQLRAAEMKVDQAQDELEAAQSVPETSYNRALVMQHAPNATPDEIDRLTAVMDAAGHIPVNAGSTVRVPGTLDGYMNPHGPDYIPDVNDYVDARGWMSTAPRKLGSKLWRKINFDSDKTTNDLDYQYALRDPRQVTTRTGWNNYMASWKPFYRSKTVPVECRVTPHVYNRPVPALKGICPTNLPQDVFLHQILELNPNLTYKEITLAGRTVPYFFHSAPVADGMRIPIPLMEVFKQVMITGEWMAFPRTEFRIPIEGGEDALEAVRFTQANTKALIEPPHHYVRLRSNKTMFIYERAQGDARNVALAQGQLEVQRRLNERVKEKLDSDRTAEIAAAELQLKAADNELDAVKFKVESPQLAANFVHYGQRRRRTPAGKTNNF